jgi:hypothetical protein
MRHITGWKRAAAIFAAVVACLAAIPAAWQTVESAGKALGDAGDWIAARFQGGPSRADLVVERFVEETTERAMHWKREPVVYEPSLEYFRDHFEELDPETTHQPSIKKVAMGDVAGVAAKVPAAIGRPIAVRARVADASITAGYRGGIASWAYQLTDQIDRPRDRTTIVCRVPRRARDPDIPLGRTVYATGVLIAEGEVEGLDGKPTRVLYMACSAIAQPTKLTYHLRGKAKGLITVDHDY